MRDERELILLDEQQLESANGGMVWAVLAVALAAGTLAYMAWRDGLNDGKELAQGK